MARPAKRFAAPSLQHSAFSIQHCSCVFDGNGNVVTLVDASNGSICARYDYGPFGESVRATGPMDDLNPIRFSTKYTDPESGLLYYGYRYYNPSTGRWLSRDPIGQAGGENLYGLLMNAPLACVDLVGLGECDTLLVVFVNDQVPSAGTRLRHAMLNLESIHSQLVVAFEFRTAPGKGKQNSKTHKGKAYRNVFFVDFLISATPPIAWSGLEGYGNDFGAGVWPERAKEEFDRVKETRVPANWQNRSSAAAWHRIGDFMVGHEVLESLSARHTRGNVRWIMAGDDVNRWQWLNISPILDEENREIARETLELQ